MKQIKKSRNKNTFGTKLLCLLFLGLMIATTGCEDSEETVKGDDIKIEIISYWNEYETNKNELHDNIVTTHFNIQNIGHELKDCKITFESFGVSGTKEMIFNRTWHANEIQSFKMSASECAPDFKTLIITIECGDTIKKFPVEVKKKKIAAEE